MARTPLLRQIAVGLIVVGLAPAAGAAEPVERFLEALRQRQYFDEALAYLDVVHAHPKLPDSVKQRALYEKGVLVVERATGLANLEVRDAELTKAGKMFAQFLAEYPDHELLGAAKNQIASLLVERGRTELERSKQSDERPATPTTARKLFAEAKEKFAEAEKTLDAQLQKMPKLVAPEQTELAAQKKRLAADLAQTRIMHAGVDYELAKSYEPASAEFKKHLKTAGGNYAAIYEAYRTRAAGLWARLWEGRCHQELGEIKQALGCYVELMDLATTSETRAIKAKSTRWALECWTTESPKRYEEAIERGERWQREATGGGGATDADALAIRYLTALACEAQSKALPAKDPNRKRLTGSARQHVTPVADHPGEYQRSAKVLLVALGAKEPKAGGSSEKTSFAEAFERAKHGLEKMKDASDQLKLAAGKADKANTQSLQREKDDNKQIACEALRQAINLSDAKTNADDLASARYFLCFLVWDSGDYYDAAVLGEFLARRYPDGPRGKQGAQIALAAYVRMYSEARGDQKFAGSQIRRVADDIFKRWPGQEEADDAALTLLNLAASQNDLDATLEYLKKVSTNSPRRGQAELRAGQALWSAYVRAIALPADQRPDQARLDEMKSKAQELLRQGIGRLENVEVVDATLASAVFALAQICLDAGQSDQAVTWLEHPKVGPLALIKAGNPVASREAFALETYKLALRAYIAVQPQQLKKAEAVMASLDKLVGRGGNAKAAENLTAIYVSLGRELQKQLEELRKSGKKKELEAVSAAFETFLDRITKSEAGGNLSSLNWVAETYFSLASGLSEGSSLDPKVAAYYAKSAAAYSRMLDMAQKDPQLKDQPDRLIAIRMRLADCYRHSNNFDEATKTILAVVRERPKLVTAQVQAAEIYQARGAVDPKGYFLAITGAEPGRDGANSIWGWAKLSQMTADNPMFTDTFHHARLSMATARYRYAQTEKDRKKAGKILEAAKQDLWLTYKLHPELGGGNTLSRYDQLLKQIQKSLGARETGLEEFKEREAASVTTSAK